jgi:hypothetical protein
MSDQQRHSIDARPTAADKRSAYRTRRLAEQAADREQVVSSTVHERGDVAYTSKTLVNVTFPHKAIESHELTLVNGDFRLTMDSPAGLPHGVYPRLILCWFAREAKRQQARYPDDIDTARHILIGDGVTGFIRELGLNTGGHTMEMVREQIIRLAATRIYYQMDSRKGTKRCKATSNFLLVEESTLWWDSDANNTDQGLLFPSYIQLSRDFYKDLIEHCVPFDMGILRHIKRSPLSIDLYLWLTARTFNMRKPTLITWSQLRQQIGAGYGDSAQGMRDFRKRVRKSLEKISGLWPGLNASATDNGILLRKSSPSVPPKNSRALPRKNGK